MVKISSSGTTLEFEFNKYHILPFLNVSKNDTSILVQFPNSVPVIVNLDLTLNFVTHLCHGTILHRFVEIKSILTVLLSPHNSLQ